MMQYELTPELLTVFQQIDARLEKVQQLLDSVMMTPKPEWLTIHAYATYVGRSSRTVNRMIADGRLEMKLIGGAKMVRVEA